MIGHVPSRCKCLGLIPCTKKVKNKNLMLPPLKWENMRNI